MAEIARWVRHNQGLFVALIICIGVTVWTYGCESKVQSLKYPDRKVNLAELKIEIEDEVGRLNLEIERILAQGELRMDQLEKMEEARRMLMNFAAITADAKAINPAGVVSLLFNVIGIGAVIDNRRKDEVIKNRPLPVTVSKENKPSSAESHG